MDEGHALIHFSQKIKSLMKIICFLKENSVIYLSERQMFAYEKQMIDDVRDVSGHIL